MYYLSINYYCGLIAFVSLLVAYYRTIVVNGRVSLRTQDHGDAFSWLHNTALLIGREVISKSLNSFIAGKYLFVLTMFSTVY